MAVGAAARYGARIVGKAAKRKLSRKAKKAVPKPTENQSKMMEQRAKFRQSAVGKNLAKTHSGGGHVKTTRKGNKTAGSKSASNFRTPPPSGKIKLAKKPNKGFKDPRAAGKMKRRPMDEIPW